MILVLEKKKNKKKIKKKKKKLYTYQLILDQLKNKHFYFS